MKKLVKLMAVAILAASSVGAITLEEFNTMIANANNPVLKQTLLCEREVSLIFKDPMLCVIAAAQISLKEYDATPVKGYSSYKEYVAVMYYNAGVIYNKIGDYDNKIDMYKRALGVLPNHSEANNNLAVAYCSGEGVEINKVKAKVKAYEHFRVAAKQGHQDAQNNLNILCKESPWACK